LVAGGLSFINGNGQVKKMRRYQNSIEAAKFKRRRVGEVAEWLKAAVC
jgi:hypothetical protein